MFRSVLEFVETWNYEVHVAVVHRKFRKRQEPCNVQVQPRYSMAQYYSVREELKLGIAGG